MLRISTTTLEAFRLYRDPEQDWMSEADLLATIRGEGAPSREMVIGRAFDAILERPSRYQVPGGYACEGVFFADAAMTPALAVFDPRGVWQVRATRVYPPDVVVIAKADQIVGRRLIENKTTFSGFDVDKYAASYQWRFMADIFGPNVVTYQVFLLGDDRDGAITLKGIEAFNVYPYPALHADCAQLVDEFRHYIRRKGLEPLLRARQAEAEARAVIPA